MDVVLLQMTAYTFCSGCCAAFVWMQHAYILNSFWRHLSKQLLILPSSILLCLRFTYVTNGTLYTFLLTVFPYLHLHSLPQPVACGLYQNYVGHGSLVIQCSWCMV